MAASSTQPGRDHLHFLGIIGHTMRGVAVAARELGYTVTGTDQGAYPPGTDWLDAKGITWWKDPDAAHLAGVDQVIVSGHIHADHPELTAAQQRGIPVCSFAELVGELTKSARTIVVAGTHGKTTTTSLLAWIFDQAGRHPDFLIGVQPHGFASSVRLAGGAVAVLEGDEYRASPLDTASKFSYYHPDVLVLTSVEMDHPDFFKDYAAVQSCFASLVRSVPEDGRLLSSEQVDTKITASHPGKPELYCIDDSRNADAEWTGTQIVFVPEGLRFSLRGDDQDYGELAVPLYGRHNVLNAVAAAAAALGEDIPFTTIQNALQSFHGVARRFQPVSDPAAAVRVIDDYAHHPTEVATTTEAARLHFPGRLLAVNRPHTYSRTKMLLKSYSGIFRQADRAYIADIEPARERHLAQAVNAEDVASVAGDNVMALTDREELLSRLVSEAQVGDTVLCMSVDGYQGFAAELADRLQEKFPV